MHGTVKRSQFGFTNSQADYDAVVAWREAAIADGWDHEPSYGGHESEDRACRLKRNGFVVLIISRKPLSLTMDTGRWLAEAQVNAWGPDGMAIRVPDVYDGACFSVAVETCGYCGASSVTTERVGFAGRACPDCAPKERAKLPPNWAE